MEWNALQDYAQQHLAMNKLQFKLLYKQNVEIQNGIPLQHLHII